MHILHVIGARPNFMKVAPVVAALGRHPQCSQTLVHSGQHYDANMSDVFFKQLGIPEPDINLGIGSGSHASQTAQVMLSFEPVVLEQRPDWVLVYGDINSTMAAALVCSKLQVPVAHVEAGLRSGDRTMPEEINRIITDQIADLLFTPSADGDENLLREGVSLEKIHMVGNVMIDTLVRLLPQAEARWPELHASLPIAGDEAPRYALVTLHRPSNVDEPEELRRIMETLHKIATNIPLIFPVHPRTRQRLRDLDAQSDQIHFIDPAGYLDFLALQRYAALVITDSGGVQEETTYLGVPCLTVRENTERPVTVTFGTNTLVGRDMDKLSAKITELLREESLPPQIPPLWDGRASERIVELLLARDAVTS